jgi:hypothetical protein
MAAGLTLLAQDEADLEVISMRLQDAVGRIKDLAYLPTRRRFVGIFNRFKWEVAERGNRQNLRLRAGLHFDNVTSIKSQNLDRNSPYAIVSLLAIRFEAARPDDCAGSVELLFAGGGTMKLEVECLEAQLSDFSEPWAARGRPSHDVDGL